MLYLTNPISFTPQELAEIKSLINSGKTGPEMWQAVGNSIKHNISIHTLIEQNCRCAFCEAILTQGIAEIEHVAPKGKHRLFTFEPMNLVTSCKRCNAPQIKGQRDTVNTPCNSVYINNTFKIAHPRINTQDSEIRFTDNSRTTFDKKNCTQLGKDTIDFFHWDDPDAIMTRLLNSNRANFSVDVINYAVLVSTYKN